jgi:outer membrane immunogenic protein
MKRSLLAGVFMMGLAGSALASERAIGDWAGAYAGAHLGYGWAKADFRDGTYNGGVGPFPVVKWDARDDGLLAGIQGGHNWQRDNLVFGLEAELGYLDIDARRRQPGVDPYAVAYDANGSVKGDWYLGLSARLGYAFERTLVYAKAGAVYSRAELGFSDYCITGFCGTGFLDASERAGWGYQLGAGVEHALSERWALNAQYSYLNFGRVSMRTIAGGVGFAGNAYKAEGELEVHTLKLGLNYRF